MESSSLNGMNDLSTFKGFWKLYHASFHFFCLSESFSRALSCLPFQMDWVAVNIWKKKKKRPNISHLCLILQDRCVPFGCVAWTGPCFNFCCPAKPERDSLSSRSLDFHFTQNIHPGYCGRQRSFCIAIYFKCLIKISWKQEVRGKE